MKTEKIIVIFLNIVLFIFVCHPVYSQKVNEEIFLYLWEDALNHFEPIGSLIEAGKIPEARKELEFCSKNLEPPYSIIASECLELLKSVHFESRNIDEDEANALARVCLKLHTYKSALMWIPCTSDNTDYKRAVPYYLQEAGKTDLALPEYHEKLKATTASDWVSYYETQIDLITRRPKEMNDPAFVLEYIEKRYMKGYESLYDYFSAMKELKRALSLGIDEKQKISIYWLFINYLSEIHDEKGRTAWEEKLLKDFSSDQDACAHIWIIRGQREYKNENLSEALKNYQIVCNEYKKSVSYGIAQFNLGMILKEQKKYADAITEFSKLVKSDVNDLDMTPDIMELCRNYRPRAQWEIGNCLFLQGDYKGALNAYKLTQDKYPFQSWCGNEHAQYAYNYAFYQGLCYDWLGQTDMAVKLYYKAVTHSGLLYSNSIASIRIVELYEIAGQTATLKILLDLVDSDYLEKYSGNNKRTDEELLENSPSKTMRRILELYQMGKNKDWEGLISFIKIKGTCAGPNEYDARRDNWEAIQASKILSMSPEAAVPLLAAKLEKTDNEGVMWLYYALGCCGTQKAVDILKSYAEKETNCWMTDALIYALGLANDRGRLAIIELEKTAKDNLKISISKYREGKIGENNRDIRFPEHKKSLILPKSLNELREMCVDFSRDSNERQIETDLINNR